MKTTKRVLGILLALTLVFGIALTAMAEDISYAPVITQQPEEVYVRAGMSFTLSVEATVPEGGTLSYQWYQNGNVIEGATGSSYSARTSEVSSTLYSVVVTNSYTLGGETLTASTASSGRCQVIAFGGLLWTFGQIFTTVVNTPAYWFNGPAWSFIGLLYNYVMMFMGGGGIGGLLPTLDI